MDSFLSNESDQDNLEPAKKAQLSKPDRKIYAIQIPFYTMLKEDLSLLQTSTQKVLVLLTGMQEGQAKRLPYNVFRSFEKTLKDFRRLKIKVMEENKKLALPLSEREKIKDHKNNNFKTYLKKLNETRNQLKQYINKLQARVQKLQDNGYAQYVEYHIQVPQTNTIRFSYCCQGFLKMVNHRNDFCEQITHQLIKRQKIVKFLIDQDLQNSDKQVRPKLPLLTDKTMDIKYCLKILLVYRYYIDQRVIVENRLKLKNRAKKSQQEIQRFKKSIEKMQEERQKVQTEMKISRNEGGLTKTDYMIYLKSMKKQVNSIMNNKILVNFKMGKRGASAPK